MIYIALPQATMASSEREMPRHSVSTSDTEPTCHPTGPEGGRRLSFHLAMEEHVARQLNTDDDCFFMWRVPPTVIFGRNQLIENEVNLDFCRAHGIEMYRRKSGGGCVYADMGNVMFSYVTRDENVNFTFNRYINLVALVLHKLGIEAKASGRNDILVKELTEGRNEKGETWSQESWRKVSGNAFYHVPGHSIVHGTMLYDTNMENMLGAITPSTTKLRSKGVESVRQHIALLKDHTSLSLPDFMDFVRRHLCQSEVTLTPHDIRCIEQKEQEYLADDFIYGHNPRYSVTRRGRLEGVGEMEARMELRNGVICRINLLGDFFVVGDIDARLLRPLRGVALQREALLQALPERLDDAILHLGRDAFVSFLLNA